MSLLKRYCWVLLAALTACASTVQIKSTTETQLGAGAARQSETSDVTDETIVDPLTGEVTPVASDLRRTATTAAVGRTATPTAVKAAAIPTTGRGWDAKTISIGVVTVKDLHALAVSLNLNLDPGDTQAQAEAVANYVNKNGGLFGRQLKIIVRDIKTVETAQDPEGTAAVVCTDFTQDRKVFMVINSVTTIDTEQFRACFAKVGTPVFSSASTILDTEAMRSLSGLFYQMAMVPWDRLAPVFIDRLKALNYFSGWNQITGQPQAGKAPKIGIVSSSSPAGTRVAKLLKATLQAKGYPNVFVYQWSVASEGQGNSVNYMAGNGVDHIIVTDLELTAFQISASTQGYRPRYGVSTYNDPYTNLELNSPRNANVGAIGIGWAPPYDVSDRNDPGGTEGAKRCLQLMKDGGQDFTNKRTARLFALATCDSILLAVDGAKAANGLDAAAVYRGALSASPNFSVALSFGTSALSADRPFVPSSARDIAYFTNCECFRYTATEPTVRF